MDKLLIKGGTPLYGTVSINGAKNAAVAILPAAILINGKCKIDNLPNISDVNLCLEILESIGAKIDRISKNEIEIDCSNINKTDIMKTAESVANRNEKINSSYFNGSWNCIFNVVRRIDH